MNDAPTERAGGQSFSKARFGRCVVYVAQREIRVDGALRNVTRSAFDLLMLLLEHHSEVVPKSVMVDRLWGNSSVAENLLAKTVVQLRRAIGDDAARPMWIKTVHRVGYRFVGAVAKTPAAGGALPTPLVEANRLRRIALLPLENRTGEPMLAWIELGLATLIAQALESDARVAVIPVATVLVALENRVETTDRSDRLLALLGAHYVVHASLSRVGEIEGEGEGRGLRLDYQTIEASGASAVSALFGNEAVQLGERLAKELASGLFSGDESTPRFDSDDPFISQLLARAMQFHLQELWQSSIQLVRSARLLEPENMAAGLLLLTNLVLTSDVQAYALGEDLLAVARSRGDTRLRGMVHTTLARTLSRGGATIARHHLGEALSVSEPYQNEAWIVRLRLVAALAAYYRNELDSAHAHYRWVLERSLVDGDQLVHAAAHVGLAMLEWRAGNRRQSHSAMERALELPGTCSFASLQAFVLGQLALMYVATGAVRAGLQLMAQSSAITLAREDDQALASLLNQSMDVYADIASADEMALLVRSAGRLEKSEHPLYRAVFAMVRGVHAAGAGQPEEARALMREAIGMLGEMECVPLVHAWLSHALAAEVRAGEFDAAEDLVQRIRSLTTSGSDQELQAGVLHAQAAQLHAQGHVQAALNRLLEAAALAPLGRVKACALLDAAWLRFELNNHAGADKLLEEAKPWLDEYPCGLMLAARRQYARGDGHAAAVLHRAGIEAARRPPSLFWAAVLARYVDAGLTGTSVTLDAAPRLVSLI